MKRKILFFAVVCTTALFLAACGGNMQSVSSSPSAAQAEEEKTIYFKTDKGLNRFFSEYASIAEYPFEPDDIKQGNIGQRHWFLRVISILSWSTARTG